jgi:hypothetical protein
VKVKRVSGPNSVLNETDPLPRPRLGRRHQLADGAHDGDDGFVMTGDAALELVHSDAETTMRSPAPRWYRKVFDRRLRNFNDRQLRRWLADRDYEPLVQAWHRHAANWSWW